LLAQYPSAFVQELALAALKKAPTVGWPPTTANSQRYLEPEEPEANA
jgi:hypothetical protein